MAFTKPRDIFAGIQPLPANSVVLTCTISGTVVTGVAAALAPTLASMRAANDRMLVVRVAIPEALAGTTITNAAINGIPVHFLVQANTGGSLVAIFAAMLPHPIYDRIFSFVLNLSQAGAVTAAGRAFPVFGLSPYPASYDSQTTAIDTSRTATLFVPVSSSSLVVAQALNDVGTANQCTWTGTCGATEVTDAAIGSSRESSADTRTAAPSVAGAAQTAIATFDVISVNGISLVAAVWR